MKTTMLFMNKMNLNQLKTPKVGASEASRTMFRTILFTQVRTPSSLTKESLPHKSRIDLKIILQWTASIWTQEIRILLVVTVLILNNRRNRWVIKWSKYLEEIHFTTKGALEELDYQTWMNHLRTREATNKVGFLLFQGLATTFIRIRTTITE
jgi:hypothetical protein